MQLIWNNSKEIYLGEISKRWSYRIFFSYLHTINFPQEANTLISIEKGIISKIVFGNYNKYQEFRFDFNSSVEKSQIATKINDFNKKVALYKNIEDIPPSCWNEYGYSYNDDYIYKFGYKDANAKTIAKDRFIKNNNEELLRLTFFNK